MLMLNKRLFTIAVISTFLLYIIYHIISGNRGIIALLHINRTIAERQVVLNELNAEKQQLERKLELLSSETPDLDYVDELKRSQSGIAAPGEIMIILEKRHNN